MTDCERCMRFEVAIKAVQEGRTSFLNTAFGNRNDSYNAVMTRIELLKKANSIHKEPCTCKW